MSGGREITQSCALRSGGGVTAAVVVGGGGLASFSKDDGSASSVMWRYKWTNPVMCSTRGFPAEKLSWSTSPAAAAAALLSISGSASTAEDGDAWAEEPAPSLEAPFCGVLSSVCTTPRTLREYIAQERVEV